MRKAVTLIELTLALALMGVIVIGIASFDVGSRKFLQASERKTQVLNEATLIMDRISRDALTAVGSATAPAIVVVGSTITINQDTNQDSMADTAVVYTINGNQILRGAEVLTNRATGFVPAAVAGSNTASVTVALIFDPARVQNAFDNPQINIQGNIEVPGWSLS
jgi:Tfp pilus assembly protein PilV